MKFTGLLFISITVTVVFLAVTAALGMLVYLSYRLGRDEVVEYVGLDDLLDAADARERA